MLLTTIAPPVFPDQMRFPRNPYRNVAYEGLMMCYSFNDKIHGFLITQHIGMIYAGFDSPPRTTDQPISAEATAALKEQVIARLQAKAKSIGASGLVNVTLETRETFCGAAERIMHCDGSAMACFVRPA